MKPFWGNWLENKEKREQDFEEGLVSKKIRKETQTKELIQGHLEKADHNLKFVTKIRCSEL